MSFIKSNRPLVTILILFALLGSAILATPIPMNSRKTTNSCAGCHGNQYELYLDITSYSVPSLVNEDWRTIQCNVSITGNNDTKLQSTWHYYESNITVTATVLNNLIEIQGSPANYFLIDPDYSFTVNFTVRGLDNGSETIKFDAVMVPWHESTTTTRSESVNVPTQVQINTPPVLSYGKVTPQSGSVKMKYSFEVKYFDSWSDLPSFINCTLDGTNYTMSPKDGNPDTINTGEIYAVEVSGLDIGLGSDHKFSFSAADHRYFAVGDVGEHTGPDILFFDTDPICNITFPTGGILSGDLTIAGTADDVDEGDVVSLVEVSLGTSSWLSANGTDTWSMDVDLMKISDGPLSIKARALSGINYSNIAEIEVTIDNSFANTPPSLDFTLEDNTIVGPLVWINGTVVDAEHATQEVVVLVGFNSIPHMATNLSQIGSEWKWSARFDLSDHEEGRIDFYAIAKDPYVESTLENLSIILDIPNILPILTLDPIPDTIWNLFEFSGDVDDEDGNILEVSISFNNTNWYPVTVSDGRWGIIYNVTLFTEGTHEIYVKVYDGEDEILINSTFMVLGPFRTPEIIDFGPESPIEIPVDKNVTFWVGYLPKDHRGTIFEWFLDGGSVPSSKSEENLAELNLLFDEVGEFEIQAKVSNAQDSNLFVLQTWKVKVKPVLIIESYLSSELEVMVGEVVLIQFGVVKGEVEEILWEVDGVSVDGDQYISFMPDEAKDYFITVTITDKYGNERELEYTIHAEETATTETEIDTSKTDDSSRKIGADLILIIGITLIIFLIVSILMIVRAVVKSRKSSAQVKFQLETPEQTPLRVQQQAQLQPQAPPQAQSTLTYHQPPEPITQRRQLPFQRSASLSQPQIRVPQDTIAQSQQHQNLQNYTCSYCGNYVQYYPDFNAYWCDTCQAYTDPKI